MIDTLRFKIPCSDSLIQLIQDRTSYLEKVDKGESKFRITRQAVKVGSYDRKITIEIRADSTLYIEFSIAKYYYGHNIYLFYSSNLKKTLEKLQGELIELFGAFPNIDKWRLYRVDLCYSWKLESQEKVKQILSLLKSFTYPRKRPDIRDTSIMFIGSAYSIKFYQKADEFLKHDFKSYVKKEQYEHADYLYCMSEGVLRFEVTLRKQSVDYYFSLHSNYQDLLDEQYIYKVINIFLSKYFKGLETSIMKDNEIHSILTHKYGTTRGIQLFQFYNLYFSDKELHRDLLKQSYTSSQIYRNLRAIREAKVGLPNKIDFPFDFSIPSKDVVNSSTVVPAVAGHTVEWL